MIKTFTVTAPEISLSDEINIRLDTLQNISNLVSLTIISTNLIQAEKSFGMVQNTYICMYDIRLSENKA